MTVSVTLAEGEDSGGQLCCTSHGVTQKPHSDMTVSVTLAAGEDSGGQLCCTSPGVTQEPHSDMTVLCHTCCR